jgi:hypothetical protein
LPVISQMVGGAIAVLVLDVVRGLPFESGAIGNKRRWCCRTRLRNDGLFSSLGPGRAEGFAVECSTTARVVVVNNRLYETNPAAASSGVNSSGTTGAGAGVSGTR